MPNLIKAYADELNCIQEEIEDLWSKYGDANIQECFDIQIEIDCLYNRKAALKAQINDLKQQLKTKQ